MKGPLSTVYRISPGVSHCGVRFKEVNDKPNNIGSDDDNVNDNYDNDNNDSDNDTTNNNHINNNNSKSPQPRRAKLPWQVPRPQTTEPPNNQLISPLKT